MKNKRYYSQKEMIVGEKTTLEGDEFLHLSKVMRTRVGESVTVFNGDGYDYEGTVIAINKNNAEIVIDKKIENKMIPNANVTLFQALVKGDKLSTIVQKNTELGIREIILFESDYSDVKVGSKNLEKLNRVMISALKQCGSSSLVTINKELKFDEMLKAICEYDKVIFAYENEESNSVRLVLENLNPADKIAVIVGAEGGFSSSEAIQIVSNGGVSTRLGKRILRAETAGIVLPALVIMHLEK